jgi:hypothetical protein
LNWTIFPRLDDWIYSCSGQAKKELPREEVSGTKVIAAGEPKTHHSSSVNVHGSLQDRKVLKPWFVTTANGATVTMESLSQISPMKRRTKTQNKDTDNFSCH